MIFSLAKCTYATVYLYSTEIYQNCLKHDEHIFKAEHSFTCWEASFELHFLYEVASVTLCNAHKKNKRAKSDHSFARLYTLLLGFWLDFEFGLGSVFPLGQFFSANQRFVEARANNFWQCGKCCFKKLNKLVEIWHLVYFNTRLV